MMTTDQRAELDAVMAKADKHGWAVDEDGDLVLRVPTCWKEGAWQDKAGRDNAAAIVALHNAYPLLTATIDAQAAEIARLREAQGWRAIDSAPDDELFIAAIEVNTVNGPVYWQMDIVYIDDETGDIALDCEAGWRLQDYSHWQPLPSPPTAPPNTRAALRTV